MNIVCNNAVLYVVDYPGIDAVEVIDKRSGCGALIRAEAAQRFRREWNEWGKQMEAGDESDVDDFIGHYGALLTQRLVHH